MAHGPGYLVVAHELRAYSEVIAAAVGALRPHLDVTVVRPAELEGVLTAVAPRLVLASRAPQALPPHVQVWIELYPDGNNHAVIHRATERRRVADIDFAALLALIDASAAEAG